MSFKYVITDRNSTGMDTYWYVPAIPSLKLAQREAKKYPEAKYIIEYKEDRASKGLLPTGKTWKLESENQKGDTDA